MLPLHVQLHKNTVHLLYKLYILKVYCIYSNYTEPAATWSAAQSTTNLLYKYCTVCNASLLTVITQKLLLHIQLHNSKTHLLYKNCRTCTVCIWTVLTLITEAAALCSAAPHISTFKVQILTNFAFCKRSVLSVITQKLPLHVQLHNSTTHLL